MLKQAFKKITSSENSIVKHLVKLRDNRAYREKMKRVLIPGKKMFKELSALLKPISIFILEGKIVDGDNVYSVTPSILKKITGLQNPETIAAEFPMPEPSSLEEMDYILAIDRISDPGNLGTLIRTALALGWQGLFVTNGSCDLFNEKTLRASRGASFTFPFCYGSIEELLVFAEKNGHTVYVANTKGENVKEIIPSKKCILVLSNEAQGVSEKMKNIGKEITIPIKNMESLNVAIAGAVLMYCLRK